MSYTHLQVRSGYSFFKSTMTIEKLVHQAKKLEFQNIALTDEAVLYGAISFYEACKKQDIKPILGLVVPFVLDEHTTIPCILLAKNNTGYRELIHISTAIQFNQEWISSFTTSNLICIVSSKEIDLAPSLMDNQMTQLTQIIEEIASHVSREDFYIGIETNVEWSEAFSIEALKEFANASPWNFTALQDVRYLHANDVHSYDCLTAMGQNKKWQANTAIQQRVHHHLSSTLEMENWFSAWPELLDETNKIASKCNVVLSLHEQKLPKFPVPTEETAGAYLRRLSEQQLNDKYSAANIQQAEVRLAYELQVIDQLEFSDYFLIVSDFVQFAKTKGIIVGPGRGSAAGSIVAYLLGITNVDPLKNDLLFERFLNPERVTMPDIDIDFADTRREEIIEYIRQKYGQAYVAQIVTFGTYSARALLRELMKTMEIDSRDQEFIFNYIVSQSNIGLLETIEKEKELQAYIKQSQKLRQLFTIALTLEGLPRHVSTHAAGIVISDTPLMQHVPLAPGTHQTHITQYAMNELEAVGLLKFDILGLRNLTLIERMVQTIERATGKKLHIEDLQENDDKVFHLLQSGRTNGVFQLESQGMKNVLTSLKPTSMDDIVAINALYRPGPMEHIPTYINRKHGKERITYIHDDLEAILKQTYGVLVYQEQIMQIVHEFAGLSLGEADILRRAISKKNRQLIEEQKTSFINGCLARGYEKNIAEKLFSWIVQFADYGFNKSHSVAYSKISYQLSYLKTYYPTYFYAHLFSSISNEADKLHQYIKEAQTFDIQVLPPSINKSHAYYRAEGNNVRMGFMAIKGIGYDTANAIFSARREKPIQDLFDFCLKAPYLKRKTIEILILVGAFDELYDNRASLLASLDQALERAELFGDMDGQGMLFNDISMRPAYVKMDDFTTIQKLTDEKELLNMYVSSHPIKQYRANLQKQGYDKIEQLHLLSDRSFGKIAGLIQSMKKIRTKRGESMAFVTIADETDEIEAVIFPKVYREVNYWLDEELIVIAQGRVGVRDNKKQFVINQLNQYTLDREENTKDKPTLYIRVAESTEIQPALTFLLELAKESHGNATMILYDEQQNKTYKLEQKYALNADRATLKRLESFFRPENVVLK